MFKVTQYCLELKKDEEGWTYEKMRSKWWQLIKHLLSNWKQEVCEDEKEVTEHFVKGIGWRMKRSWGWMGVKEMMTHISWRIELKRMEWTRGWKEVFTSDLTFPGGSWGGGRVEQLWQNEREVTITDVSSMFLGGWIREEVGKYDLGEFYKIG